MWEWESGYLFSEKYVVFRVYPFLFTFPTDFFYQLNNLKSLKINESIIVRISQQYISLASTITEK